MWEPWTQNLYVYVGNNPVNYVDPTGHQRDVAWGRLVGIQLEQYVSAGWDMVKNTVKHTVTLNDGRVIKVIPDFFKPNEYLVEVKNVAYQHLSRQLQGMISLAKSSQSQFILVVREGAKVTQELIDEVAAAGGVIVTVTKDTISALAATAGSTIEVFPMIVPTELLEQFSPANQVTEDTNAGPTQF